MSWVYAFFARERGKRNNSPGLWGCDDKLLRSKFMLIARVCWACKREMKKNSRSEIRCIGINPFVFVFFFGRGKLMSK